MSKSWITSLGFVLASCGRSEPPPSVTQAPADASVTQAPADASVTQAPADASSAPLVVADPSGEALLEEAASDALMAFVVRPARWVGFRDAVVSHLSEEMRGQWSAMGSAWNGLDVLAQRPVTQVLPSLDVTKPVVVGLFVTRGDVLEAVAEVVGLHARPAPVRHRVLLPALDADKLVGELKELVKRTQLSLLGGEEEEGAGWVSLHVEGDHVRVELSLSEKRPTAFREVDLQNLLAKTPKATLEATAGRQLVLGGDAFVSFIAWPQRLRDTFGTEGAQKVGEALRYVDPEMSEMLRRVGVAEVLSGWPLLAPERALTHDVAFAWDGRRDGLVMNGVATLTEKGAAVFDAAAAGGVALGAPTTGWARAWLGLSPKALLGAIELPAVMVGAKGDDLAERVMECGYACRLSAQGLLAVFKGVIAAKGDEALVPSSAALAVGEAATFALAFGYAGELDEKVLPTVKGIVAEGVTTKAIDGGVRLAVAKGLDPDAVFVGAKPAALMTLDVELGALARTIWDRPVMNGRLRARLDRSGATLVTTAHLAHDAGVEAPLDPRDYSGFGAATAPKSSAARDCLEKAVVVFAGAWKGMANGDPERAPLTAAKANVDAMGPLACAEADASTKAEAARLREIARVLSPMPTP